MTSFGPKSTAEDVTEGRNLSGKTFLVTGCSSGLGLETMRVLTLRGARVLGSARTEEQAATACASVRGDAVPIVCELSSPQSIRAAVRAVDQPLNGIIANAGVMALRELRLHHGVEAHMFVNHVGHFMLICGLLDRLHEKGRIVMVSSGAHTFARGNITFEDLGWDGPYDPWAAYGRSKLANISFAKELAERLPVGQTVNAVHPGVIDTPLFRHLPGEETERLAVNVNFKTVEEGAATQVFVATHTSAAKASGMYFVDCAPRKPSALARDKSLAAQLWQTTEAVCARL